MMSWKRSFSFEGSALVLRVLCHHSTPSVSLGVVVCRRYAPLWQTHMVRRTPFRWLCPRAPACFVTIQHPAYRWVLSFAMAFFITVSHSVVACNEFGSGSFLTARMFPLLLRAYSYNNAYHLPLDRLSLFIRSRCRCEGSAGTGGFLLQHKQTTGGDVWCHCQFRSSSLGEAHGR